MRLSPETTGALPSTYLRVRRRTVAGPSFASSKSAMKPSSLRMRAISRFVRDAGTITSVCRAREALRTRVSMSAMGSETFMGALPARLRDARQLADQRPLPEADPAEREPAHVGPGAPTDDAAVIGLRPVLGRPGGLGDHRFLGHRNSLPARARIGR